MLVAHSYENCQVWKSEIISKITKKRVNFRCIINFSKMC